MATVALLVATDRSDARRLASDTAAWLEASGHRARLLVIDELDRVSEDGTATDLLSVDLSGVDLAVSLGGDGSFLRIVPLTCVAGVPVLGVNFGRLGYLMEVQPDEVRKALERALTDEVVTEDRVVLAVTVQGELVTAGPPDRSVPDRSVETGSATGTTSGRGWLALNEMVAQKTVPGHTVRLATLIDHELFLNYSADGVLVATPTGSTAYNLSAGGPALSPRLEAMIVTPIAPHLSVDRSLVLDADRVVTIRVLEGRRAALDIDGREVGWLSPGSEITCQVAKMPMRVVSLGERGFAGLLRSALAIDRDG